VLGVGRDSAALERVGREAGPGFVPFQADVTEEAAPREIVAAAVSLSAPIGGLVQAAGIIASGAVDATSDEGWDTMFGVNVRAPFRLLRRSEEHTSELQSREKLVCRPLREKQNSLNILRYAVR